MKKFLFLVVALMTLASITYSQTYIQRNTSEGIVRKVTTSDNTATKADSITVLNDEAGIFQVKVIGLESGSTDAITGTLQYTYSKASGTLTLSSALIVDTLRKGSGISGATFAASASNNNIKIAVTGVSSKTIRWSVITKQYLRRND